MAVRENLTEFRSDNMLTLFAATAEIGLTARGDPRRGPEPHGRRYGIVPAEAIKKRSAPSAAFCARDTS